MRIGVANFKSTEMRFLDSIFDMGGGYVLDFSNRTMDEFFMEELEIDCAQRILDFMAGAIYALDGTIYKISRGIFVVAPTNYDVIGNDDRTDVDVI